jgi:Fe-Mn family superoxide dismutase
MTFELMPLPYSLDSLEPVISERTLEFHWGKHHKGYVEKLNKLIPGTRFENLPLEEIILESHGSEEDKKIFNNAAQVWNHNFFWKCMDPSSVEMKDLELLRAIDSAFGSLDKFKEEFVASGKSHFGSGWTWLIKDENNELKIISTHDAENPLVRGETPLLTCDVWEHAYYLDYQNARDKFIQRFWQIVNWDFVQENFRPGQVNVTRQADRPGRSLS